MALAPIQMGARLYLPSLGRFTSLDPVLGGNANSYAYTLDPINSSDYSGKSCNPSGCIISGYMQITISGASLQGSSYNPQATASIQYVQPAISYQRIQVTRTITMSVKFTPEVTRAVAKPRDNSTAMPMASVSAMPLAKASGSLVASMTASNSSLLASILPAGGYTGRSVIGAAALGCVSTSVWIFVAGGIGTIATGGLLAGPAVAAIVGACGDGAGGGVITYGLTGDNAWEQDTSSMQDVREYYSNALHY